MQSSPHRAGVDPERLRELAVIAQHDMTWDCWGDDRDKLIPVPATLDLQVFLELEDWTPDRYSTDGPWRWVRAKNLTAADIERIREFKRQVVKLSKATSEA